MEGGVLLRGAMLTRSRVRLAERSQAAFQRQFELFHSPLVPLSPPARAWGATPAPPSAPSPSSSSPPAPAFACAALPPSSAPSSRLVWDFERSFLPPSDGGALDRTDRDGEAARAVPAAAAASAPSGLASAAAGFGAQLLRDLQRASLRLLRKSEIAAKAAYGALARPTEDEHVATLSEVTSDGALERLHRQMWEHPDGRRILEKKPLLDDRFLDYAALRKLPQHTLGWAYMQFMDGNELHAGARQPVRFVDDPELSYVLTRYRQLHDFMHTIYGAGISVAAEVALKLIEFRQTGLPMTLFASVFGSLATPVLQLHVPAAATDGRVVGAALAGKMRRIQTGEEASTFSKVNASVHLVVEDAAAGLDGADRERETRTARGERVLYPRHALLTELLPWAWAAADAVKVPLHLVYVEEWLERPLDDLRRHCGVLLPPAHLAPHFAFKV
ncbi:coenzyme q (ubiquinone) biosynthesis protein coq4 protein [Besnoitia besnoiti]|uniref:Ubiquinone biosynthesis protein COQ4 homolog, mitochondrial n=1 Tax=Besnoitia besnoiti TaxID=94643 RepID=A0A2A9LZG0_BESBE|nr:coenzyme q (ubiquinone) biosynthesis protein coq4 protein [Besnoitia besnoiti]PFH31119.1 coenzyme q (ubiquinone) biosynthesis protein coq4 protein [Besnoitia besnoiti]